MLFKGNNIKHIAPVQKKKIVDARPMVSELEDT